MALKLTEREIALAKGLDPDRISQPPADENPPADDIENESEVVAEIDDESHADTDVDSDGGEAVQGGAAKEGSGESQSWIDAEAKQAASDYGISEADLASFASKEQLQKALEFYDRQLYKAGSGQQEAPKPTAEEAAEKVKQESAAQKAQAKKLEKLSIDKYKAAGFGEESLELLNSQNSLVDYAEQLEQRIAQMQPFMEQIQQEYAQRQAQQVYDAFHNVVNGLDESRYGRTVDASGRVKELNQVQERARSALYEGASILANGIIAEASRRGVQPVVPPMSVLVKRAEQLVFGEEIRQAQQSKMRQQVAAQSAKRRAVASSRSVPPPAKKASTEAEERDRIANHPDIVKRWKEMMAENGSE